MSHTNKIFEEQPVSIQNLNGFDLSHIRVGSAYCGTLTPVLCRLLMPGSKFSLGVAMNVELPPLATNFFGRVDAICEFFFAPCAVLYGGWRQFISNQVATMFPSSQNDVVSAGGYTLPVIKLWYDSTDPNEPGSIAHALDASNKGLADYLGLRVWGLGTQSSDAIYPSLLSFLAYHLIWNVFYRNASVTKTIFAVNPNTGVSSASINLSGNESDGLAHNLRNVSLIWHSFYTKAPGIGLEYHTSADDVTNTSCVFSRKSDITFPDGISVLEMRQRNWSRGYFTAASVDPQMGNPSVVGFVADLNTGEGEISIAALRAANSLQKWLEAMNYDPTYRGIMRNHFGVSPSDAELDEPSYIGRCVIPVYQKSVYQSVNTGSSTLTGNPFTASGQLGAKGASGSFSGEGKICQKYRVNSFGYLMGIFSLVPHAMYSYGTDKHMFMTDIAHYPFPELQGVGMDSIKNYEVYGDFDSGNMPFDDFAYIGRYSYFKYCEDVVCGELVPGKSLSSFVLQRVISSQPDFSTEFLEIPTDAMDSVLAVSSAESKFTCWFEIYFVFKLVQPLAAFCVPTLGDIKDTHTQYTTQGGSRL